MGRAEKLEGGMPVSLGSPTSRAMLAVAKNKRTLAELERKAKNNAIKKQVTKKNK